METDAMRYHLTKYAYCQSDQIANIYKDFIRKASEDDLLTVYNHFQFYVFPFFIPKKATENTNAVRTFFNKIRERFIWLTLYHFTSEYHLGLNKITNYNEYYKAIDKMFVEFKVFLDEANNKTANEIYNKILSKLQNEGHWLSKYDTINYVKINSLNDLNEPICTYFEDFSRLILFVNNKYYIKFDNMDYYLKAKAELEFAYDRHLTHGHQVTFEKEYA